jgi:hypothetical protein
MSKPTKPGAKRARRKAYLKRRKTALKTGLKSKVAKKAKK